MMSAKIKCTSLSIQILVPDVQLRKTDAILHETFIVETRS